MKSAGAKIEEIEMWKPNRKDPVLLISKPSHYGFNTTEDEINTDEI